MNIPRSITFSPLHFMLLYIAESRFALGQCAHTFITQRVKPFTLSPPCFLSPFIGINYWREYLLDGSKPSRPTIYHAYQWFSAWFGLAGGGGGMSYVLFCAHPQLKLHLKNTVQFFRIVFLAHEIND